MADDKPTLWYASITSWQGISIGATHWYVKLRGGSWRIDLQWTLDEERTKALNAKDDFIWEVGSYTNRFDTREQALAASKTAWEWLDGSGSGLLLEGDGTSASPPWKPPIAGDPALLDVACRLYERAEAVNWWDGSKDQQRKMDVISDEWQEWVTSTFVDDDSSDERCESIFIITGPPEAPDGVWCQKR